jgi:hypothetical protein
LTINAEAGASGKRGPSPWATGEITLEVGLAEGTRLEERLAAPRFFRCTSAISFS